MTVSLDISSVPAILAADLALLVASLDCAGFCGELGAESVAAQNLDEAADAAENIVLTARKMAQAARERAERGGNADVSRS